MNIYVANCSCGCSVNIEMSQSFKGRVVCGLCGKVILSNLSKVNIEENLQCIDEYLILKLLGHGCSGSVYLAYSESDGLQIALKILEADSDIIAKYFQQEISILSRLNHPNIIKIKDWGMHKSKPYFVMEYLQGETLAERLNREIFPTRRALKIVYYVLDALSYAHQKGVIHRDIKPGNVYIAEEGVVKVIDLGIAKIVDEESSFIKTGQVIGSVEYMSPEQMKDSKHVDIRTDIYSVGAMLFHTLCGLSPFDECKGNLPAIFAKKDAGEYISLRERKSDLSPAVLQIVEKAMAQTPDERYQSCDEMKEVVYELITMLPK